MHFQLKSIGCLSYPITHHAKRTATLMWQPLPKSITYLFCAQVCINSLQQPLFCTHCQDDRCSSCHGISTGKHTTLGCSTVFFLCHDTLSAVRLKSLCRGRNQRVREVPSDMMTVSASISYSDPGISTGLLLPGGIRLAQVPS